MRFADIACGSGSFLLGVYEYLLTWHTEYYNQKGNADEAKKAGCIPNEDGTFHLSFEQKSDILVNNVYGVDIDRQAHEVTQLSLFLKLLEEETLATRRLLWDTERKAMLPSLAQNIICGNALVDWDIVGMIIGDEERDAMVKSYNPMDFSVKFPAVMRNGCFDAIVGNPPFGAEFDTHVKVYLNRKFVYQNYQLDSYILFLENALTKLLKPLGYLGYIIPNPWLSNLRQDKIRKLVVLKSCIRNIVHFKYKVFSQAVVDTEIVILQNDVFDKNTVVVNLVENQKKFEKLHESLVITHKQKDWTLTAGQTINIFLSAEEKKLLGRIQSGRNRNLETLFFINVGIKPYQTGKGTPKQTKEIVSSRPFDSDNKATEWHRQYLRGTDINRYLISPQKLRFIKYGIWLAEPRPAANFDAKRKIFMRQTGDSLIAAMDEKQLLSLNNMHVLVPRDNSYDLNFMLGIINSKLLNWIYQRTNPEVGEALAEVKKDHVAKLPIRQIDIAFNAEKAKHDLIVHAVEQIMDAIAKLATAKNDGERQHLTDKCEKYETDINTAVYSLYGLTPGEIQLVEGH